MVRAAAVPGRSAVLAAMAGACVVLTGCSSMQVPEVEEGLASQLVEVVSRLRSLDLRKSPSIAESVDWARTLVALGTGTLDEAAVAQTLGVVLKHHSDHERALKELKLRAR